MRKQQAKSKLLQAFKAGDLHLTYKSDNKDIPIMPKIRHVDIDHENKKLTYVFTIPLGLDPSSFKKKMWVFEQQFGKNIELDQDNKKFTLTIYGQSLPDKLIYNFEKYSSILSSHKLPVLCGKDANGQYVAYDMVTFPHLLVAGETGSGKSTQLRSVLTTLIQSVSHDRLQMYLGDLKRSEFHLFKRVKHVKGVYTKANELKNVMNELKREMEERGDLLDQYELTHIDDLNKNTNHNKPYVLVCIDEVALLKKENEIMAIIEDISAIGRALGVFLILSMQRPDRDILDGKLKNNLTVRMGFKHSNLINSRITDTPGAEKIKLEQRGRMLLKLHELVEIQAPYLSDMKAKKILEGYKSPKEENTEKQPLNASETLANFGESKIEVEKDEVFGVLDE